MGRKCWSWTGRGNFKAGRTSGQDQQTALWAGGRETLWYVGRWGETQTGGLVAGGCPGSWAGKPYKEVGLGLWFWGVAFLVSQLCETPCSYTLLLKQPIESLLPQLCCGLVKRYVSMLGLSGKWKLAFAEASMEVAQILLRWKKVRYSGTVDGKPNRVIWGSKLGSITYLLK